MKLVLDIPSGLCYYNIRKRKDTSQTRKEKKMRNFFRDFELDAITVLGGILVLSQVGVIVGLIMMYITR